MSGPPLPADAGTPDSYAARVRVTQESYARLIREFALDVGCRPHVDKNPDGTGSLQVFASAAQIKALRDAGYDVQQGENVSELGRRAQAEVGKGDRFEGGRVTPRGLGRKPGADRDSGGGSRA